MTGEEEYALIRKVCVDKILKLIKLVRIVTVSSILRRFIKLLRYWKMEKLIFQRKNNSKYCSEQNFLSVQGTKIYEEIKFP